MNTTNQQNYFDALFFANASSTSNEDFHLRPTEFKLLLKLIHYSSNQKNITWVSEEIGKHTSMNPNMVDKAIQRLKQKGYITTSTYSIDTFIKKRTIFINWDRINKINELYLISIDSEAPESIIYVEQIENDQTEEIVPQIEDNEVKLNDLNLTMIKELSEFKSVFNFYIPKLLIPYMYLVEDKKGLINRIQKQYNQSDFNLELLTVLQEQHNKQFEKYF